jgi:hypothetical protein
MGQPEGAADLPGVPARRELDQADDEEHMNSQGEAERRRDARELSGDVLPMPQRRAAQQLGDPALVVAEERQPGHDRGEEAVDEEADQAEALSHGIHGVDEQLLAPGRRISRRDQRGRIDGRGRQPGEHHQDPEQGAREVRAQLLAGDRPETAEAVHHGVSPLLRSLVS